MGLKNIARLSLSLAKAEFKLRNEGSYLGILWYLLNPLLLFGLLFLIFSDRVGQGIPNYPLYLMMGLIMFNLFQKITSEATQTIISVGNRGIIRSINFPKESLALSIVLKFLYSHIFEIVLFGIFMILFGTNLLGLLFYLPILLLFLIFCFGSCLILSALTVYFIDLDNIWKFGSMLIWLGTPIFYAVGGQTRLFYVNLFNPVYYFITISRELVIYNEIPELWLILGAVFYALFFLLIGLLIFNRLKIKFAEMI